MCFLWFDGRILSTPKARPVLVNTAVRKGERLIPPSAFEILLRVTFPPSSTRVKVDMFSWLYMFAFKCIIAPNLQNLSQYAAAFIYRLLKDLRPYMPLWKRWLLEVLLEVKQWNKSRCRYSILLSKQLEKVRRPDFIILFVPLFFVDEINA